MVLNIGVQNNNAQISKIAFGSNKNEQKNAKTEDKYINDGLLLAKERDKHPLGLNVKIQANKMKNAFTKYPKKGITGSKNANFYEFLTMGTVPYLIMRQSILIQKRLKKQVNWVKKWGLEYYSTE